MHACGMCVYVNVCVLVINIGLICNLSLYGVNLEGLLSMDGENISCYIKTVFNNGFQIFT